MFRLKLFDINHLHLSTGCEIGRSLLLFTSAQTATVHTGPHSLRTSETVPFAVSEIFIQEPQRPGYT